VNTLPRHTALLLVAAQQAWDDPYWGARNNPEAEANMAALLQAFRAAGLEVVHVRRDARDPNSPLHPGEPGHAFKAETGPRPAETVLRTSGQSAFTGSGLEDHLRRLGIDRIILAGFTTSHGISSTARHARDLGFKTVVLRDACVAFELEDVDGNRMPAGTVHQVSLAELHGEVAMVLPTEAILQLL
jgi:nicotinamidase-related amidase